MSDRHRKLRMESMEARQMMAGDVTASVVNGSLYLDEALGQAGRDNSVLISQIAPGQIRVTGTGVSDGTRSLINGAAYQDFTVPQNLVVKFGGGNDQVVFDGNARPTFQDVNLDVAALDTQAPNTPDTDQVMLFGGVIRGSLTVNTGASNDWVFVSNTDIGDDLGVDNVTINTGASHDSVTLKNLIGRINGSVDIQTYGLLSEVDPDVVSLENVHAKVNLDVRLGDGNDQLFLFKEVSALQDITLNAGAGDDIVEINYANAVDDFMAELGDGNDTLTIKGSGLFVGDQARISAGNGFDNLYISAPVPGNLTKSSFERINGWLVNEINPALTPAVIGLTPRR